MGALLVALPRPVLGGVFVVVCGTIVYAGAQLVLAAAPRDDDAWVVG